MTGDARKRVKRDFAGRDDNLEFGEGRRLFAFLPRHSIACRVGDTFDEKKKKKKREERESQVPVDAALSARGY